MQRRSVRVFCVAFLFLILIYTLPTGGKAEGMNFAKPEIAFDSDAVNNALIIDDEEIYLCGLTPNGSWLRKTNVRNEVLGEWHFTDKVGKQPVIQCLAVTDGNILAGLVDSYTQKAAVAVLCEDKISYIDLPESGKVLLWGMRADDTGISIIFHSDAKSQRTIYYTHVSPDGMTDSFRVGQSTIDDVVIADSFAYALKDTIYLLRMTKIDGVVNNCNRELVAFDWDGRQLWQILLPSDIVVTGISSDENHLYLYGFQRLETANRAYLMSYGLTGDLEWAQAYDGIEQCEYVAVEDETIYLAGESEDLPGQWIIHCLGKDGTQLYTENIVLPEAYHTLWSVQDSNILIIQNVEEKPYLWQLGKR